MTSDEIRNLAEDAKTDKGWLKEIAFQLAILNERNDGAVPMEQPKGKKR